jgi:hypothetical protein
LREGTSRTSEGRFRRRTGCYHQGNARCQCVECSAGKGKRPNREGRAEAAALCQAAERQGPGDGMGMGSGEAAVNAALSDAALGDRNYPATWWSVFITKGNADLHLLYFRRLSAWLTVCAAKGAGSTERGDEKGQRNCTCRSLSASTAPPKKLAAASSVTPSRPNFPSPPAPDIGLMQSRLPPRSGRQTQPVSKGMGVIRGQARYI